MGQLIPEDFPLAQLRNEAERRVVEAFRDQLNDGWLIVPALALHGERRDYELDVVLVHHDFGVADVEVKGHRVEIRHGIWCSGASTLDPQPLQQARDNAYALRHRLRMVEGLDHLQVEYAVALPNTGEVVGELAPGMNRSQVLTGSDLEDAGGAVERLMLSRWSNQSMTRAEVEGIIDLLCPNAGFSWDPAARAAAARSRLDQACADQIAVLERLDANRRVMVTGSVGTGKTRLATAWTRRAFVREDRTMLTCYNDPLADDLRSRLPDDPSLRIGAFLKLALNLEGMPHLEIPADAGDQWWSYEAYGHLHRHWHKILERFDTIVVDEAQDFSPAWIGQLASLLNWGGRLFLLADEAQVLYPRGFSVPAPEDGWTRCELVVNCRNTYGIARLLRSFLDGAPSPASRPGSEITWRQADDVAGAVTCVREELHRLLVVEERAASSILVETTNSAGRDAVRRDLGLVSWEGRSTGSVVCETVHRSKGLEADTVVLVVDREDPDDRLLYVGISRAVSELVLVGPHALARRFELDDDPVEAR